MSTCIRKCGGKAYGTQVRKCKECMICRSETKITTEKWRHVIPQSKNPSGKMTRRTTGNELFV